MFTQVRNPSSTAWRAVVCLFAFACFERPRVFAQRTQLKPGWNLFRCSRTLSLANRMPSGQRNNCRCAIRQRWMPISHNWG